MILFIKTEDGKTLDHPVADWNLIEVYGQIPANYEPFERAQKPQLGRYEMEDPEAPLYIKVNGVWTDSWASRPMTEEERADADAEWLKQLEDGRSRIIAIWEEFLADAQNDAERKVCEDYIAIIKAETLRIDDDYFFPDPPMNPQIMRLVGPKLATDVPGAAPDVIG